MTTAGLPVVEKGYAKQNAAWWPMLDDEQTPELIWPRSVEVYDRMRRQDAQVMSVLRAVTLPIRRTSWRVDGEGCRPEVTQLIADDLGLPVKAQAKSAVLRTRDRFSWVDHLRLALLELPHGHAFFEQVYRIDDAGLARLRKLGWRPPKTIEKINVAADGGLISIEQFALNTARSQPIEVGRLVAYVNDREGGNWLGQSLLRPAYKFWLLKDRALRTQAQTLERNGLGIPTYTAGKYPDEMDATERKLREDAEVAAGAKLAAAARAGDNAGMAMRNGAALDLKGVTGTLPDADKPIRYYDEQIARAVLAHFLNLGTETGSWALGSTFADFFTLSLQTVAQQIADVTNQHVVEDLVDINWGPDEPAPRIVFDEIGSRNAATADAIKALIDCKAITPDEVLEQHVRTTYGLPAADPGSARETTPVPPTPPPPSAPGAPPEPRRLA